MPERVNACDLCGSRDHIKLFDQTDFVYRTTDERFPFWRCNSCGLVFLSPRPDEAEMKRYYPDKYSFYREGKLEQAKEMLKHTIYRTFYREERSAWRFLKPLLWPICLLLNSTGQINTIRQYRHYPFLDDLDAGRILDVGCGTGTTFHPFGTRYSLKWLSGKGIECEGVETDERACAVAARHGLQVHAGHFDRLEFEEASYDVVRMNYSLEHVHSPSRYLDKARQVLKRQGRIIISVPNYEGITYALFPNAVEAPRHLFYFTESTLRTYLHKSGFVVTQVATDPTPEVFHYVLEHLYPDSPAKKSLRRQTIFSYLCFFKLAASIGRGDDITVVGIKS